MPPGSSASRPRPAYELVAEAIERKILAGRLKPGDPVGTESELVKQFGVNRSTVREGIRLLEQSGLVAREPSRRLSVAVPHYHRLATRMTRALILQQVTFRELWHTSRALEPAAVDQAMDNATEEDLAALAANVDKTRKAAARSGRRRRARRRVPQADRQGRAQPRAAAGQGALQHAGAADHRLHHLQQPGRHSRA